jgi:hypothetical protein
MGGDPPQVNMSPEAKRAQDSEFHLFINTLAMGLLSLLVTINCALVGYALKVGVDQGREISDMQGEFRAFRDEVREIHEQSLYNGQVPSSSVQSNHQKGQQQ